MIILFTFQVDWTKIQGPILRNLSRVHCRTFSLSAGFFSHLHTCTRFSYASESFYQPNSLNINLKHLPLLMISIIL